MVPLLGGLSVETWIESAGECARFAPRNQAAGAAECVSFSRHRPPLHPIRGNPGTCRAHLVLPCRPGEPRLAMPPMLASLIPAIASSTTGPPKATWQRRARGTLSWERTSECYHPLAPVAARQCKLFGYPDPFAMCYGAIGLIDVCCAYTRTKVAEVGGPWYRRCIEPSGSPACLAESPIRTSSTAIRRCAS